MEQRSFSGKSQWYHETQSSQNLADVQPLVPEAAQVEDRFLLDLKLTDAQLASEAPWLSAARALSSALLPERVETNRLHTLSNYERLSTALTVAQVFGVQRLCNHYAARLAPESSSDSSRETNRRLTQITQFSRQLASQPTSISDASLIQLLILIGKRQFSTFTMHSLSNTIGNGEFTGYASDKNAFTGKKTHSDNP